MARLEDYQHLASGKVREIHRVDEQTLLFVATDRISAYDHILPTPIPDKGRVLTAMSMFWFDLLADLVPNHVVAVEDPRIPPEVLGRAMLVQTLGMIPVECVARGYLAGSGLLEYRAQGTVCGLPLPAGLTDSSELPEPIFTPAAKAEVGLHDENIDYAQVVAVVGDATAAELRRLTLAIYTRAAAHAAGRGVLLADTKFEFGRAPDGTLVLGDEVLTPDSSRFWPAAEYRPGRGQASFDKQFVRDWLTSPASGWDRTADTAPPELPADVVQATRARYVQAYEIISGMSFDDWPGVA